MPTNFIRLYLDEDVSVIVGEMIRARGFDVTTTRDVGNLGVSDSFQLEFATENELVLLTHNRVDFEKLAVEYFDRERNHSGIIIATRRLPRDITLKILTIFNTAEATEMVNQIRYI